MGFGKIDNMEIIPDAGAVRSIIIIAEYLSSSLNPYAVCVIYGTRFSGTPLGNSPMRADG